MARLSSRAPASARRTSALVRVAGAGLILPPNCACCGEPASGSEVVRSPAGTELFVGYCEGCLAHVGGERTRRLAAVTASFLFGFSLALALPLASEPLPAALVFGLTAGGALAPLVWLAFWPRFPERGHVAVGPAVRFVAEGELLCANDRWALDLARENDAVRESATFRERRLGLGLFPAVVLAPVLALLVRHAVSPIVRVVNLSTDTLTVEVDGRTLAKVEPTSLESPTAGVELRLATGRHELVARGPKGAVIEQASVSVVAGRPHLFAPASDGHCFWLETRGYGRDERGETEREPLSGSSHFWALPADLGGWFHPVPDQAVADERLTGGRVTVLRQGPCDTDLDLDSPDE
jgi:hypothetical protein